MKARVIIVLCMILLFVVVAPTLAQENSIVIPSGVQVKSLHIKLSEIAEIKGEPQFVEQVANLRLGKTPYPGYKRVIYREDIMYALQQKNINLASLKLRMPYQITVQAAYNQLDVQKLINYGKEYIIKQLNYKAEQLEIEALNPPQKLLVPKGEISFVVVNNYAQRLLGVNLLPIKVKVNGELYRKFYIKFKVELWQNVLIAKERLRRGQDLSPDLFVSKQKLITDQRKEYVSSSQELEDKILKRPLAANNMLTSDLLANPVLVKRWQEVELIAKVGNVIVSTTGKALEEGHQGDLIKVMNTGSNQKIKARVVGPNQVEAVIN